MSKPKVLPVILTIFSLLGCRMPETEHQNISETDAESEVYFNEAADAEACKTIATAVAKRDGFDVDHYARCDGIIDIHNPSGFRVARLNGFCREEICGSVLVGWFAVEEDTRRVFEVTDVGDWTLGKEVTPSH